VIAEAQLGARAKALLKIVPYEWAPSHALVSKTALCNSAHSLSCSLAALARLGLVESMINSNSKKPTLWRRVKTEN
jgi:hypothetical protein